MRHPTPTVLGSCSLLLAGGLLTAPQAAAQDHRIAIRDAVRHVLPSRYQGRNRGPDQTEAFSRRVRLGRNGRVSITNIAGDISVTSGSGDEVSIEATKRTRGDRSEFGQVQIVVDEGAGRVDVRTDHAGRNDHVSVDFVVTVPSTASVELHSVSGALKVQNVQGAVRAETISGNVTTTASPHVAVAKSVSGDVDVSGATVDGDLAASSLTGTVRARGVKARGLQLGSVSGNIVISDAACDRLDAKSVTGSIEYTGALAKSGRYSLNSHSGSVRVRLAGAPDMALEASTFSGSIHSDLPLTIGGDADRDRSGRRRFVNTNRTVRARFGDGAALLTVRTFSGDIAIQKQ